MQLQVKTLLNALQHFPGFVFQDIRLHRHRDGRPDCLQITVEPHGGIPAKCSRCLQPAPGYDRLPQRSWLSVPVWGVRVFVLYAARRVDVRHPRGGRRARSLERWQTTGDLGHDVLSVPLGAATVVARDGPSLPNQLGMRLSLGWSGLCSGA